MLPLLLRCILTFLYMYLTWTTTAWNTSLLNTKSKGSCSHPDILCDTSKCIGQSHLCDGNSDCVDGIDESLQFCGVKVTCADSSFNCKAGKDNTPGECIQYKFRCDGKIDCYDGSDEEGCHSYDDGSDEVGSHGMAVCDGFTCSSGKCLSSNQVCNGIEDCDHNEDENDCKFDCNELAKYIHNAMTKRKHTELIAPKNGCDKLNECVNETKLCDNVNDCKNGADEPDICSINECHSKRKRCSHNCRDMPIGYSCSCYDGYQLATDLHRCQDVNECLVKGSCSQLCHNMEGGFTCSCKHGYKLSGRSKCKALGEKMFFLLSEGRKIVKITSEFSSPPQTLIANVENVGAISYLVTLGYVYWSDMAKHQISRISFFHPNEVEVVINDVGAPEDLAVDWIAYKLYWVDGTRKTIEVSELDGNHRTVLLSHGLSNPKSIVLDPREGNYYIYWCDWGSEAKIERISLDGDLGTRSTIYNHVNSRPNGLVIDFASERLYWFDELRRTIESSDINGGDHDVFNVYHEPTSLVVFEDYVYWTCLKEEKMFWINKLNGERGVVVYDVVSSPKHLTTFHEAMQPEAMHRKDGVHCTHLKLLSHRHGYRCVCPAPLVLLLDGKTCNSTDVGTCHADFCYHGGVCYDEIDGVKVFPRCRCPIEFNGSRCENRIDVLYPIFRNGKIVQYKCIDNYCYNEGICVEFSSEDDVLKPKCRCLRGYYGNRCEFYYGYLLRPLEVETFDDAEEEVELIEGDVDIPDHIVNIAAGASAIFLLVCVSLIFLINRLLRRLPSYDIVVNPIYMATTEDENNDDVIINVERMWLEPTN